jgi:molybdenum cofactor biosynthesis enzyme MoaA
MVALHALGLSVTMMTNGLLLKPDLAQTLLHAGLDKLVVSLDSMHLQAYHQAGMTKGLDNVLDNLHGLHDLIRAGGWNTPALGLEYVVTRSNQEELYKLPGLASQVGATFRLSCLHADWLRVLYDRISRSASAGMGRAPRWMVRWCLNYAHEMGTWRQCRYQ